MEENPQEHDTPEYAVDSLLRIPNELAKAFRGRKKRQRKGRRRRTFGTFLLGFSASAAVSATTSVPRNEKAA